MNAICRYDGLDATALAHRFDLPHVALYESVPSTMDEAHALARNGAPAGTLVLAERQERGRGRGGKVWTSLPGHGIWMTLLERPREGSGVDVLSLRVGVRLARALDRFVPGGVRVKWPNDLMVGAGKVAGILVEARWRDQRPEWVAIGIGINLRAPDGEPGAAALGATVARLDVLGEVLPVVRAAARAPGGLDAGDLRTFDERDWARGRRARAPHAGIVAGVSAAGALLLHTAEGTVACVSGPLVLEEVGS